MGTDNGRLSLCVDIGYGAIFHPTVGPKKGRGYLFTIETKANAAN
jgi:hypothetical protein